MPSVIKSVTTTVILFEMWLVWLILGTGAGASVVRGNSDVYDVDISEARNFPFDRIVEQEDPGMVAAMHSEESRLVATVLPAPPEVAAMHMHMQVAEQNVATPILAWPEDGEGVVTTKSGSSREVISSRKRTRVRLSANQGGVTMKNERVLHPDELSAPKNNNNIINNENNNNNKKVRTSVTKSVQMVVGNVHVANSNQKSMTREKIILSNNNNNNNDNNNILDFGKAKSEPVEKSIGDWRRRKKVVRKKKISNNNNNWVSITTARTSTVRTPSPAAQIRRPLLTNSPILITPLPNSHISSNKVKLEDNTEVASIGSLLVSDPYEDIGDITTFKTITSRDLKDTHRTFKPKMVPKVLIDLPNITSPPQFRPSPRDGFSSPAPTRPTPPRPTTELAITFLPPLSDSNLDKSTVFGSKNVDLESNIKNKAQAHSLANDLQQSFRYKTPSYRTPIRNLSGNNVVGTDSNKKFNSNNIVSKLKSKGGKPSTYGRKISLDKSTSSQFLETSTSPGPPYNVPVTPTKFSIAPPPPSIIATTSLPLNKPTKPYYDFAYGLGDESTTASNYNGHEHPTLAPPSTYFPATRRTVRVSDHGFPDIVRHISTYSRRPPFENIDFDLTGRQPRRRLDSQYEYDRQRDVVDFGGASGGHGGFGWYSDHPISIVNTW